MKWSLYLIMVLVIVFAPLSVIAQDEVSNDVREPLLRFGSGQVSVAKDIGDIVTLKRAGRIIQIEPGDTVNVQSGFYAVSIDDNVLKNIMVTRGKLITLSKDDLPGDTAVAEERVVSEVVLGETPKASSNINSNDTVFVDHSIPIPILLKKDGRQFRIAPGEGARLPKGEYDIFVNGFFAQSISIRRSDNPTLISPENLKLGGLKTAEGVQDPIIVSRADQPPREMRLRGSKVLPEATYWLQKDEDADALAIDVKAGQMKEVFFADFNPEIVGMVAVDENDEDLTDDIALGLVTNSAIEEKDYDVLEAPAKIISNADDIITGNEALNDQPVEVLEDISVLGDAVLKARNGLSIPLNISQDGVSVMTLESGEIMPIKTGTYQYNYGLFGDPVSFTVFDDEELFLPLSAGRYGYLRVDEEVVGNIIVVQGRKRIVVNAGVIYPVAPGTYKAFIGNAKSWKLTIERDQIYELTNK